MSPRETHRALVLAVEPDQQQARVLAGVIRQRVKAELVVVDSRDAAIAALSARVPDVMLLTALLSPRDEDEMVAHLRSLPGADHVQTHTIPQLASGPVGVAAPAAAGGLLSKFRRKKEAEPIQGCDPALFADEVSTFLARAAELKSHSASPLITRASHAEVIIPLEEVIMEPAGEASGTASSWASPFEWRRAEAETETTAQGQEDEERAAGGPTVVAGEEPAIDTASRTAGKAQRKREEAAEHARVAEAAAERLRLETEAERARMEAEVKAGRALLAAELEAAAERARQEAEAAAEAERARLQRAAEAEHARLRIEAEAEAERTRHRLEAEAQAQAERERLRLETEAAALLERQRFEEMAAAERERARRAELERERLALEAAALRAQLAREAEAAADKERLRLEAEAAAGRERARLEAVAETEREQARAAAETAAREQRRVEAEAAAREEQLRREAAADRARLEAAAAAERAQLEAAARADVVRLEAGARLERERLEAEASAERERSRREAEDAVTARAAAIAGRKQAKRERAQAARDRERLSSEARAQREEGRDREAARAAEAARDRDPFADFRTPADAPAPLLDLMPVARWAKAPQPRPSLQRPTGQTGHTPESPHTGSVGDELRELMAGLALPARVAGVTYARGCRIRRVRVPASTEPALPAAAPVIVSRRALDEMRTAR